MTDTAEQPPVPDQPPLIDTPPADPAPVAAQPYGAQPYGAQPYGAQPYGAQPYGAQSAAANPFQPRGREPWINPAKRGVLAAMAAGIAVVLLAVGFGFGALLVHHHDNRLRAGFGGGFGSAHTRQLPGGYRYGGQFPGSQRRPQRTQPSTLPGGPATLPSPSSTS
jgi:hypothetical protein